ncbi:MAG: response regulator transcription factor [Nitrospirae bacterium]|uniref:winged helix-turn-helix domain-containing protein n=1 Tax=Candidatus Magnetobacterium casense TaxID=1455061 RepID=UPI0012DE68EB|nr:response regulator transcription factor [Candidatus Magnetobacterium casensis]MBF0337713.1 response regulator transcription factor [Nitrospirota bacterium]
MLRRTGQSTTAPQNILRAGDIKLDAQTYMVSKKGVNVNLSATEFRLLHYMMQRRGRVLTRDMLLDAVWRDEAYVEPRTVDVHIRRLREQIEEDPARPVYIKTRRGIGYYFEDNL